MKKYLLFLVLIFIILFSGCSKKETETGLDMETDMPEKNTDCTFKAVVTEVNDGGMVVKPVPGSGELKSSDAIAIGKAAITDNSQPEIGDTYEIVYDGRILETYPAGLSNISSVVLVAEHQDNEPVVSVDMYRESEPELEKVLKPIEEVIKPDTQIIDTAEYDIDGDGRLETLTIIPGTDSDNNTVIIVSYDGMVKFSNTFSLNPGDVSFHEELGRAGLAISQGIDGQEKEYSYHDLYIENDTIFISGLENLTADPKTAPRGCFEIYPDDNDEQLTQLVNALDTSYKDFSQSIYDMIAEDWERYNLMDYMQRMASSHTPGYCFLQFDSWSEATEFIGVAPWNPFENEEWLTATKEYRIVNHQKNSMNLDYKTDFYGDADGILKSISLSSDYPLESGFVNLIINLSSEMNFSAWSENEEGGKTRFYQDIYCEEGIRTITKDVMVVHTENYDAIRIALPEASNFKYLLNVTSYNGTGELAKMFDKASQTLGLNLTYKTLMEGVPEYLEKKQVIKIAQEFIGSGNMSHDGQILNFDAPIVENIEVLPEFYYQISEPGNNQGIYYRVTFTTDLDDLLGPIRIYIDNIGTVIGLDYRE